MRQLDRENSDERIQTRFGELDTPIDGDVFVSTVMRRVRRRLLIRRIVLGSAVILGTLVAVAPLTLAAVDLGTWLAGSAANWRELGANDAFPLSMALLLMTAAWLASLRWLAR